MFSAIAGLLPILFMRKSRYETDLLRLVMGVLFFQWIGICLQAKFFTYHYGAAMPFCALLCVWGLAKLTGAHPKTGIALSLSLALLSGPQSMVLATQIHSKVQAMTHPQRRDAINDRLYRGGNMNTPAIRKASRWLKRNSPENEPIYVWGFEPAIYFLSNRSSASKYIYNVPQRSAWSAREAKQELMGELRARRPSSIVTSSKDPIYHVTGSRLDSAQSLLEFPELSAFIKDNYRQAAAFHNLTVYTRSRAVNSAGPATTKKKNPAQGIAKHILLITIDTLRADYLSGQGYALPTTPNLDRLFSRGTVFGRAITPIPRTTQALASLLTGQYPHTTGVRTLLDRLPEPTTSIAEIARQNGYRTVAVVSNHLLTKRRGLDAGFDIYDHAGDARGAQETTRAVLDHLTALSTDDSVFVWVHYIDPHVPYYPAPQTIDPFDPGYTGRYRYHFGDIQGGVGNRAYPADLPKVQAVFENRLPPRVNEHIRRLYAADIRDTDTAIGILYDQLAERFGDDWTTIITADHGESLGEHEYYFDHGDYVFNPSTHVPLAILLPRTHQGSGTRRVNDLVSLVDIAPTLIDIVSWEHDDGLKDEMDGRSLYSYLRNDPVTPGAVFAECGQSYFPSHIKGRVRFDVQGRIRAIWKGDWKLIWFPFQAPKKQYMLFNVISDPRESENLIDRHPQVAQGLARELMEWHNSDTYKSTPSSRELDKEDVLRLKRLGYLE